MLVLDIMTCWTSRMTAVPHQGGCIADSHFKIRPIKLIHATIPNNQHASAGPFASISFHLEISKTAIKISRKIIGRAAVYEWRRRRGRCQHSDKKTHRHTHTRKANPLREKVPLSPQLSSLMTTHPRGVAWRGGGTRTGRTLSRTRLLFYPSPSLFFFIIHISTLPSVFLHCELFIAWVRYGRGVVGRR